MNVESRNSEKAWNRAIVKAEQEAAKKKMERLAKMRAKAKRKQFHQVGKMDFLSAST